MNKTNKQSSSKSKLSSHCIAMAKMVAYKARILNFLQLHPVISILNNVHKELLKFTESESEGPSSKSTRRYFNAD